MQTSSRVLHSFNLLIETKNQIFEIWFYILHKSSETSSLSKQIKFAAVRKSANLFTENSQSSHPPWRLAYNMSTKKEFSDLHIIPLEDLEKLLKTNTKTGLSTADALEKLKTNGKNVLTPPKKTPEWVKFMKTMFTGFAALLWIAGILCFIAYIVESSENPDDVSPDNLYIGCALVVVVAISGIFTYMQERQSGKIMESFSKMVPPLANVLRDGKVTAIEACDIVLGDVVEIRGGDKVPADLRIFESNAVKVKKIINLIRSFGEKYRVMKNEGRGRHQRSNFCFVTAYSWLFIYFRKY